MAVIMCDGGAGAFSVTIIPKSGSTSVRHIVADCAQPGQYHTAPGTSYTRIREGGTGWQVGTRYKGQCGDRSWAIIRNPWQRQLSRWREKKLTLGGTITWPDYAALALKTKESGRKLSDGVKNQAWFLGAIWPKRLVRLQDMAVWIREMEQVEEVSLRSSTRLHHYGNYDWRKFYRDHPKTRDLVREAFAADWELGLTWEDPLG